MAKGFSNWGNRLHTGELSYQIVQKRKRYYLVAIALILAAGAVFLIKGFNLGLEFKGGTQFTISSVSIDDQQKAVDVVSEVTNGASARVSTVGNHSIRVQTVPLDPEVVVEVQQELAKAYEVTIENIAPSTIGPSWGKALFSKALIGVAVFVVLVSLVMVIYFREWQMSAAAVIALFHDLILTVGIYAVVGWEITPATFIGFLTITGYSIYDKVVVFDKIRENTKGITEQKLVTYEEQANLAVNQTLVRSINTSVVALLPVGSILVIGAFMLGAGTLRDIALALFVGMAVGAYSSIFLGAALVVSFKNKSSVIIEHNEKVLKARGVPSAKAAAAEDATSAKVSPKDAESAIDEENVVAGARLSNASQPKRKKSSK